jgi:general secretion pathway protein D
LPVGTLLLAITLVLPCAAMDVTTTGRLLLGTAVPGQLNADDAGISRQQAAQLLKQARLAMERGQLQLAENYLERAEGLNPTYDLLTVRFQDTPAKVRADLVKQRDGPGVAATKPQGQFLPLRRVFGERPSSNQVPAEPYSNATERASIDALAGQTRAAAMASVQRGRQALRNGDLTTAIGWYHKSISSGVTFTAGEYGPPQLAAELMARGVQQEQLVHQQVAPARLRPDDFGPVTADRVQPLGGSSSLESAGNVFRNGLVNNPSELAARPEIQAQRLHVARRAMATGDLGTAALQLEAARQLNVAEQPGSDTPARVSSMINRAHQLARDQATQGNQPRLQREQALFMMEQAEALLQYRDYSTARWLAEKARALPVRYQALDPSPLALLAKISAREQGASVTISAGPSPQPARNKTETLRLLSIGKAALDRGDTATAHRMLQMAESLQVPDTDFGNGEMRPWQLRLQLENRERRAGNPVQQVSYPAADGSQNLPAAAIDEPSKAAELYQQGLQALAQQDRNTALAHFRAALAGATDMALERQIREKISLLVANQGPQLPAPALRSPLEELTAQQRLLRQKLFTEIAAEQKLVETMGKDDPKGALERLLRLRKRVGSEEDVDATSRKRMVAIVDRSITSMENYINANLADIELDAENKAVLEKIRSERDATAEMREELASMVDQFNTLIDEGRYAEAEVIAKQAREIAPQEPVVQNLIWKSRFARRIAMQMNISEKKEQGFLDTLVSVDRSSEPFDDSRPFRFDDARDWNELTRRRRRSMERQSSHLSPAGMKIQNALKQPVDIRFNDTPLSVVMETLGRMTGINVHLDRQGLSSEGVTSDTPVSINLSQPVSLKSALNLMLEELRLSYVIRNEVLLITSEMSRDTNVYQEVYNVADLVIPIPDFNTGQNVGLPSAIREAHNVIGYRSNPMQGSGFPLTLANGEESHRSMGHASVLAQMAATGMAPGSRETMPTSIGHGRGGAAMADFDSLIELITTTVEPDSWEDVGGAGTIKEFAGNLSLVISATQQVHEQITDLLEQLRRLQDLQITIEVRFITLSDNFYERIGIDFDFEIDDNVNVDLIQDDSGPSVMFGLDSQGPTVDLDLVFDQGDAYNAAIPQFGGFDAASAFNFGFAILSDIEVFFLLQAAIGDSRSNVLTAPKVTLFNGQQASVSDTSQRPFVTGVIPVVGDFAAAHQPVIVVLSEGTNLSVQAVCSNDRRFVRLTLVPFFSRIGEVEEFTFDGRRTTSTGETVLDPDGNPRARNNEVTTTEGTTVQLPTFQFTTVSTTVSVPDGGTVLLGGIKRLSEGRTERGVPMLAQLPYINRLFKNVGIGRDTQSLMMMVTPRIIIQEEEELAQTGMDSSQL